MSTVPRRRCAVTAVLAAGAVLGAACGGTSHAASGASSSVVAAVSSIAPTTTAGSPADSTTSAAPTTVEPADSGTDVPPTTESAAAPVARHVEVVGDSISMLANGELHRLFGARGWTINVTANSSTTVETNRARIRAAVARRPSVVVVELGTNDAGQIGNVMAHPTQGDRDAALARTVSNIHGALDDLASIPCVVWVDVNDWTNAPFYDVRATAPTINAALVAEDAARPSLHLAPYRQRFAPSTPAAATWLRTNFDDALLHPDTAAARQRIASLVLDAVSGSCPP